jgi:transposase
VERAAAVTLLKVAAAEQLGCSRQTVAHWQQAFEATGDVHSAARSGRPRCTTEEEDIALVTSAVVQPFTSPHRLHAEMDIDASSRTIDRRLIEAGLPGHVARHKRAFTEEDKRKRLSFAQGYSGWTEEQWEPVLFADEAVFEGAGFSGQQWVRRPPGEALNPEYCVDKKPHPVKVNVWACFCARGPGYTYIFNENLDSKLLKHILSTHLLPSAHLHYRTDPPEQWWLLQDNDPKHKSRSVQNWLHNNGINCLDFPPYSPDLNPIEHVWADLARRVERKQPSTMEQLQEVVAAEWTDTSLDLLAKLAHSMPARCKAVIEAQGDHTRF